LAVLPRAVQNMKQRAFVADAEIEVFNDKRRAAVDLADGFLAKRRGFDLGRAGFRPPDLGEMRLPRSRRPNQRERWKGPIRPAVYERDGGRVGAAYEEILDALGRAGWQIEDELGGGLQAKPPGAGLSTRATRRPR